MAAAVASWSRLNPNAPMFVPAAYRQVEDFSPEWWDLVQTCSWFRDYWLSLHPDGVVSDAGEDCLLDDDVFLPDAVWCELGIGAEETEWVPAKPRNGLKDDVKAVLKGAIVPKSSKPVSPKSLAGFPKYQMKATYNVSPKCTPRRINQPR